MKSFSQHRRRLNLALGYGVLLALAVPVATHAQSEFPSRQVTVVIPYPPGGLADATARRMGSRLSEMWKVPVVVDNKPGATGNLGAGMVVRAPADGHTLLFTIPEALGITKASRVSVGFDPVSDVQPIALVALSACVLIVNAESPHKTFKEYIEFARKNPGKLNFGVQGTGSSFHLALEQLKMMSGAEITAIPYKGAAPTIADLLGNRLDGMIVSASVAVPHIKSGKLRALAIASKDRLPELPGVPTIAESGFPGYDFPVGLGVFVRAGTPKPIVDKLSTDIRGVFNEPSYVEWLSTLSTVTTNLTPEQFNARWLREITAYEQLIAKSKIKFE